MANVADNLRSLLLTLMDYVSASHTTVWQWDRMYHPGIVWNFLDGDEDGMMKTDGIPYMKIGDTEVKNGGAVIYDSTKKKIDIKDIPTKASTVKMLFKLSKYQT